MSRSSLPELCPAHARRSDPYRRVPMHADERVDPANWAAFEDDGATGAKGDRVPTYPPSSWGFVAKKGSESIGWGAVRGTPANAPRSISKWAPAPSPRRDRSASGSPTRCPAHGGTFLKIPGDLKKMPGRARRSDPYRRVPMHADERVDPANWAEFKDVRATGAQGDRVPTYPIGFVAKTRGESLGWGAVRGTPAKAPRSISKWASTTFPLERT